MEIEVDKKSPYSLKAQIANQVRFMIEHRVLKPNEKLPTVRQLAGHLGVNQNTALQVYRELEKEGYIVCTQGKGTYVAEMAGGRAGEQPAIEDLVREFVDRAIAAGTDFEELERQVRQALQAERQRASLGLRALVVECNRAFLEEFTRQLRSTIPVHLEPILIADLERMLKEDDQALKDVDLVITILPHIYQVEKLVKDSGPRVIGLYAAPAFKSLMRIAQLPRGSRVAVVCAEEPGTEVMVQGIQQAGIEGLKIWPVFASDLPAARDALKRVDVAVSSWFVLPLVEANAPEGLEIIPWDQEIDAAGINMLREVIDDLAKARLENPQSPVSDREA